MFKQVPNFPLSGLTHILKKASKLFCYPNHAFISLRPPNAISNIMADTLELSWPLIWWRKYFFPWDQSQCIRSQRADQLSEHFPLSSLLRSDVQTNLALFRGQGGGGGNQIAHNFSPSVALLAYWQMSPCKISCAGPWKSSSCAGRELVRHGATGIPHDNIGRQAGVLRNTRIFQKKDYGGNHACWPTPWPGRSAFSWQTLGKVKTRPWVAEQSISREEQSAYACSLCDKKWDGGRVIKTGGR